MSEIAPPLHRLVVGALMALLFPTRGRMKTKIKNVLTLAKRLCEDMEADKHRDDKTLLEVQLLDAVCDAEKALAALGLDQFLIRERDETLQERVPQLARLFETSEEVVLEKLRKAELI